MNIHTYSCLEGARKASGTTVIIDVFRAFTLEAYLIHYGAKAIYPVGSIEDAYKLKERYPDALLFGERKGKKIEGFDYGNSPSSIRPENVKGKVIIHTTSAGTQGLEAAKDADMIIAGSLVTARAIADYIRKHDPIDVSLVAMGNMGTDPTEEDELCAQYIKALLEGRDMPDIRQQADDLRYSEGKKFFDPAQQEVFPQGDFACCTNVDQFSFVLKVIKKDIGFETIPIKEEQYV